MIPSVRKRLRSHIDALYKILHNEELLPSEFAFINSGIIDLIKADYHLSHLKLSHNKAKEIFGLHHVI